MVRVVDGTLKKGDKIRFMADEAPTTRCTEMGSCSRPSPSRSRRSARRGRLHRRQHQERPRHEGRRHGHARRDNPARAPTTWAAPRPLPGFKDVKPMVFAGIFPTDSADYPNLRDALEKLHMNDAAFSFEPDVVRGARLRLPLRLPRACSTWRSSRSGSSASSTWTSSRPRRASSTTSTRPTATMVRRREPGEAPAAQCTSTASRSRSSR